MPLSRVEPRETVSYVTEFSADFVYRVYQESLSETAVFETGKQEKAKGSLRAKSSLRAEGVKLWRINYNSTTH